MLKRHQVLLDDWQVAFLRYSSEKYDFSFSEVVRIFISEAILSIDLSLNAKTKLGITSEGLTKLKEKVRNPKTLVEDRHKILSKVYFEARKAAEELMDTEK